MSFVRSTRLFLPFVTNCRSNLHGEATRRVKHMDVVYERGGRVTQYAVTERVPLFNNDARTKNQQPYLLKHLRLHLSKVVDVHND